MLKYWSSVNRGLADELHPLLQQGYRAAASPGRSNYLLEVQISVKCRALSGADTRVHATQRSTPNCVRQQSFFFPIANRISVWLWVGKVESNCR